MAAPPQNFNVDLGPQGFVVQFLQNRMNAVLDGATPVPGAAGPPGPPGPTGPQGPPLAVQDEGAALTQRSFLNFVGAGVTATDDSVNNRTTVTIPGGGGGAVTSVFTRTGAVVAQSGDYSAFYVPLARQVIAGAGLTGGGSLVGDVTLNAILMGASGASHAAGIVPDPGAAPGATRYLREDATWGIPAGAGGGLTDPTTTKGDLLVRGVSAVTRLGVGTDTWVLVADSAQTLGVKWAAPAAAGVSSVFTRTGAVVAQSGDYTAAQVTNAVSVLGSYADPAWITSLAWSKITGAPATGVSSVFTRTGAVVALAADYSAFYVPLARQVLAGTGLTGGGALSADVTLTAKAMVASGASHSAGMVPDPGATAGTTKFLREDASWQVPAGGGSQTPWLSNIDGGGFSLTNVGQIGIGTSTPAAALDVAGIVRATGATAPTSGVGIELAFSGSQAFISAYDRSGAAYKTLNISGLQIWLNPANGGQVGIGTATPVSRLSLGAGASSAVQRIALFELTDGSGPRAIGMANPTGAVFGLGLWLGGAVPTDTNAHVFFKDGGAVGIGTMSPAYKLDVVGDINASTLHRRNGLPICQISGGFTDATASRVLGTTYQNNSGVPIFISITMNIAASGFAQLLTDIATTPTNIIAVQSNSGGASANMSVCGWVMPTHWYKINQSGATLTKWYEWQ